MIQRMSIQVTATRSADVEGAHAGGIRCVGITLGRFGREDLSEADAVVEDFTDLLRALP